MLCLAGLAFLIASAAVFAEAPILSAPEAFEKVQAGELVLVDIRSREEWQTSGVPDGAWPVSLHEQDFPKRFMAILEAHPAEKIAVICATGGRTAYVTSFLEENGITGISDVSEGMFGNDLGAGWIARGLPMSNLDQAISRYDAGIALSDPSVPHAMPDAPVAEATPRVATGAQAAVAEAAPEGNK